MLFYQTKVLKVLNILTKYLHNSLNEILMVATNNIKTPFFAFPVNVDYPQCNVGDMSERNQMKKDAVEAAVKSAERISKKLNKVLLKDVCF